MFASDDSVIARLLQEEYDREAAIALDEEDDTSEAEAIVSSRDKQKSFLSSRQSLISELSPVDPSLELSDPTPDIILLFLEFNERYFWGSLAGVEVKWSPRMTVSAGLCVYEGRGGLCSVRLSLPLLKLRPRKDLVETLLHEMIHAYLFVTNNDRDHSHHGPNFLSHMDRLNKATGANISVYHTFHDEVDFYKQHWWRCNGPCQWRAPHYGYIKRCVNRKPSANDIRGKEHQATCGGVYTKIREPGGYVQNKSRKADTGNAVEPSKDIQSIWGKGHTFSSNAEMSSNSSSQLTERNTFADSNNASLKTRVGNSNYGSEFNKKFKNSFPSNKSLENSAHGNGKSDDFSFRSGTTPEIEDLGSQASVSENGAIKFTGQGYKPGTEESGSSFLSMIRNLW